MFKVLLALVAVSSGLAMEKSSSPVAYYILGGIGGGGSKPGYIKRLLNDEQLPVTLVPTPKRYERLPGQPWQADLGQEQCLAHLRKTIHDNNDVSIILHASSQGAATAFNYIAHEDKGKRIVALILQGAVVSGNSAIMHNVNGPIMEMQNIAHLPLSYYWLPYIAKSFFPHYSPAGKQPIKSVAAIPLHMPIVLVHCPEDPQAPYTDACALYYGLRAQGNQNIYFVSAAAEKITPENKFKVNHTNLFEDDQGCINKDFKCLIAAILAQHHLRVNANVPSVDLKLYQPDHRQYKHLYDALVAKEKMHEQIQKSFYCTFAIMACAIIYKLANLFTTCAVSQEL